MGRELSSVARAVCVECESASAWAKRFRLPSRMGIEKLRMALDVLARVLRISWRWHVGKLDNVELAQVNVKIDTTVAIGLS